MNLKKTLVFSFFALFVLTTGSGAWYPFFNPDCTQWDAEGLPGIELNKHYLFVAMGECDGLLAIDPSMQTVAAFARHRMPIWSKLP